MHLSRGFFSAVSLGGTGHRIQTDSDNFPFLAPGRGGHRFLRELLAATTETAGTGTVALGTPRGGPPQSRAQLPLTVGSVHRPGFWTGFTSQKNEDKGSLLSYLRHSSQHSVPNRLTESLDQHCEMLLYPPHFTDGRAQGVSDLLKAPHMSSWDSNPGGQHHPESTV